MKKIILILAIAFVAVISNAQEKGKFRIGADFGYAIPKGGAGLLFAVEGKYNIKQNWNVGIRFESANLAKEINEVRPQKSANLGYLVTSDYYFNKSGKLFAPFVGGGLGVYGLSNLIYENNPKIELNNNIQFGGLLRAGFEVSKGRLTLGYNIIPKSKFDDKDLGGGVTQAAFNISNNYIYLSLGFYIGGGVWKKKKSII